MPGNQRQPWNGPKRCTGKQAGGLPCTELEIDGLEHCFWHVPEEYLEEAEEITGLRRCRAPGGCPVLAVEGTVPPRCAPHGAREGSVWSKQAANRVIEGRVLSRFEEIMSRDGERLLNPPKLGDPFTELLSLAAEVKEMKNMLLEVVSTMKPGQYRYAGKTGEQARAEIVLLERAQERLATVLTNIIKLGIEDRLAGVEERTVDLIERALDMAVKAGVTAGVASGSDLDGQHAAREVLRRELPVLAA